MYIPHLLSGLLRTLYRIEVWSYNPNDFGFNLYTEYYGLSQRRQFRTMANLLNCLSFLSEGLMCAG